MILILMVASPRLIFLMKRKAVYESFLTVSYWHGSLFQDGKDRLFMASVSDRTPGYSELFWGK